MTQPDAGAPTVSVVGSVVGSVSVVVVSRHRPAALSLCLTALTLQDHPGFEIVLVADPGSVGVRPDLPIKRVRFDAANISAARNAGVMAAAGEVVAFIDDDAVAEPTWLSRLTAPCRAATRLPPLPCRLRPGPRAGATGCAGRCGPNG